MKLTQKQAKTKKGPIGVFDSGFGGLAILKKIVRKLPAYDYVYLGDTARAPYGSRSPAVVYEFVEEAIDFLFAQNCQLIILACNTASSEALRRLQQNYLPRRYPHRKVLGVLVPAAEEAAYQTKNRQVGIIATPGTVRSGAFIRELKKLDGKIQVSQVACPLLVPLVEAGEENHPATELILERYLRPLQRKKIDTLILGCTHYGILEKKIKKIVGPAIHLISEGQVVAQKLKNYLDRHPEIESRLSKKGTRKFYSTDLTDNFEVLGSKFFGRKIKVRKIRLPQ